MKTFKLILKSLISNNACIEGGRKKPWFFATIMLFLSMILAILPLFVSTINTQGDDAFKSYSYGADQAMLRFNEFLEENKYDIKVEQNEETKEKHFVTTAPDKMINFSHSVPVSWVGDVTDFKFFYRENIPTDAEMKVLVGEKQEISYVFFTSNELVIHLVNFNTKGSIQNIVCTNAPKYIENEKSVSSLLSTDTDPAKRLNDTFANWKLFIRDGYNFTRLTMLWQTCAIMGGINLGITLLMGFMIWILTRGKNNPYKLFNIWECQKMSWWAAITPSILALAFGFLVPRFANILFPMLIGIRVMWLSMKSLRPDGSGYAESN